MKLSLAFTLVTMLTAGLACAQKSPDATASVTIDGKKITVKYAAPSVRGRKIFGDGGLISHDPNYPIWRAGANSATAFHTDADLDMSDLRVPKGDYTLFVDVADPDHWKLIVSKKTGEWGLSYPQGEDLGRVPMAMSKPPALVEQLKYEISGSGKLTLSWENHVASVDLKVK